MVTVLVSGGIDSLACLVWAINKFGSSQVRPLYVNFGQRYADTEIRLARTLCDTLGVQPLFVSDAKERVQEDARTGFIPFRNLLLLLESALPEDSSGVVFGTIKGDNTNDTSPAFVRAMQKLFDSQLAEDHLRKHRPFTIWTPFRQSTKTEIVSWLKENLTVDWPGMTVGCYSIGSEGLPCGNCMSCFNRWVALTNNAIDTDGAYAVNHPFFYGLNKLRSTHTIADVSDAMLLRSVWVKRRWIFDAYRAMNRHSQRYIGVSFPALLFGRNS